MPEEDLHLSDLTHLQTHEPASVRPGPASGPRTPTGLTEAGFRTPAGPIHRRSQTSRVPYQKNDKDYGH